MHPQVPQEALFAVNLFSSYMNQSLREDTPHMVGYTTSTGKRIRGKDHIKLYNLQNFKNVGDMLFF